MQMKQLRIHYLQHASFEGLGNIGEWSSENGHLLMATKFYENSSLPDLEHIDWLIIMGGPMGVYDEKEYRWLKAEKQFIKQALEAGKPVIGVCLGSQLIADALGAKVYVNNYKEIGWYPIELSLAATKNKLFEGVDHAMTVFHWHGDTFDLPQDALQLASSEGCQNQGFLYHKNVLGLQFHLEMSELSLKQMLENGKSELIEGKYIQSGQEILNQQKLIGNKKQVLFKILDRMATREL